MAKKRQYTPKTMIAYKSATKSRITTLCSLREAVIGRYLNTTAKEDSELAFLFSGLISKYDDLINAEREAFALFCTKADSEYSKAPQPRPITESKALCQESQMHERKNLI